jgi:transposase
MSVSVHPPAATNGAVAALPPVDQLALLALGRADLPEITHRRRYFAAARRFVGLDIHREYFVATAVDRELLVVYGPRRVTWEGFEAWIAQTLTRQDAVVVEMTTNTWQVHDGLAPHVHSVTVVHPPHVKLITQAPVMNDKKAAEALAMLHAAGLLRSVWVPNQSVRDRRQLVAQRHDRVRAATQAKNRLHAILHRHSLDKPATSVPFAESQRGFWQDLPVSPVEQLAIELDLETVEMADRQRQRLEAFMIREVLADERLPFVLQLPGVSLVGALTILAAIGPIERFASAKELVGYSGLGGKVHDSGQTHRQGKITKYGRRDLRSTMVHAAQAASRSDAFWKAELARLEPRLGRNKAIVAIARRMLVVVWHVLTRREGDRHADVAKVAARFLNTIYTEIGARNLPGGMTGPEGVRHWLDQLGLGKELQRVRRGSHSYLLPQSSLPGAPPAAEPRGNARRQNTKAAQDKRLADAVAKREALAAQQAEAEARMGRPRKTRSDKGVKRGPRKKN